MRIAFAIIIGLSLASVLTIRGADDTPNDSEKKAIAALKFLKAKTTIDTTLHPEARVAIKLETANDVALVALDKHPEIGSIQALDGTLCTTKGFTALHALPHLRRFVLNKSGVTDKELNAIVGCKEIRELVIPESTVTDAGLPDLTKLTRLEALDLSDAVKITDKGMAVVKTMERLETLHLNKTSITDKGLLELKPLEGLRALSVGGTKVTQAAAEKFPDEMPNLRVVRR